MWSPREYYKHPDIHNFLPLITLMPLKATDQFRVSVQISVISVISGK
jgi:hypothetical protein